MSLYQLNEGETLAALTIHLSARTYHQHTVQEMFERIAQHPAAVIGSAADDCRANSLQTCRHCGRHIINDGGWIDPEATGDDIVWRETCDANDTFTAEHEPAES